MQWIAEDPRRFAWQVWRNAEKTWQALFQADLLRPWQVALAALGIFARPWTCSRLRRELLLWLAMASLASMWVYFIINRFLLPAVPNLHDLGCHGPGSSGQVGTWVTGESCLHGKLSVRHPMAVKLVAVLPLVLTLLFFIGGSGRPSRLERSRMPFFRIEVARWSVITRPPAPR